MKSHGTQIRNADKISSNFKTSRGPSCDMTSVSAQGKLNIIEIFQDNLVNCFFQDASEPWLKICSFIPNMILLIFHTQT